MLRLVRFASPLLFLALTLAACTGGDEDPNMVAAAAQAKLQGAILGNLDRMVYYTAEDGSVKGEKMSVTGSNYTLRLDTTNHLVYNLDSLPVHTFMDKIYFSTFYYVGTPYIQEADSSWTLYEYTKPQDFSTPRRIGIKSTDGTKTVEYTIDICAHKENGDSMQWFQFTENDLPADLTHMRMIAMHDSLYLWGKSGGATLCCKAADTLANKWIKVPITKNTPDVTSIVKQGERFCGLTSSHIVSSTDGAEWQVLAERPADLKALVAASTRCLYGITNEGYSRALVADMEWTSEASSAAENWPASDFCSAYQTTANNDLIEEITLIGRNSAGSIQIWRRNDMHDAKHETTAKNFTWTNIKTSAKYPAPDHKETSVAYYDGGVLMAGVTAEGKVALSLSPDNGLTWPARTSITTPDIDLSKVAEGQGNRLAMSISATNRIWIYANGQLWRGFLNRMTWK